MTTEEKLVVAINALKRIVDGDYGEDDYADTIAATALKSVSNQERDA